VASPVTDAAGCSSKFDIAYLLADEQLRPR
jgi:hypothetical protein